jgi:O-antigen ligase
MPEFSTKVLFYGLIIVSLIITPWFNLDAVSLPKFVSLSALGFVCWALILMNLKLLSTSQNRTRSIIVTSLVFWLIIVSLLSNKSNLLEFYGTQGRNTGLLTYLSLAGIFLLTSINSDTTLAKKILKALSIVGMVTLIYGYLQYFEIDPFPWNNPYSPIVGTFGNPNFTSSFLGFFCILVFSKLLQGRSKPRFFNLFLLLIAVFLIYKSDSIQGLFVAGIGIIVLTILFTWKIVKKPLLAISFVIVTVTTSVLFALGVLGRGPLALILSQGTITFRQDYWSAGWKMFLSSPISGLGMDSYGDWYREFRSVEATNRRGPEIVTDSAHNVFIDLLVSGGIPFFALYCLLLALVIKSIIRITKDTREFDVAQSALIAIWVGHLAQSFFSINQIGLAAWFWSISGALIAATLKRDIPTNHKFKTETLDLPAKEFVMVTCAAILALATSLPPLIKDHRYIQALNSKEVSEINLVTRAFPKDEYFYIRTALLYKDNNLFDELLPLARESVILFPRNYWGWKLISENSKVTDSERARAVAMLKRLDPHNPNNPK